MNFPLFVAKRYLFSKKSFNAINIITTISIIGVAVGTMSLVAELSVFNGLENFIESLYNSFNPDISISVVEGTSFNSSEFPEDKIRDIEGVVYYSEVAETYALLKYDKLTCPAILKGVDSEYKDISAVDSNLYQGKFVLEHGDKNFAVIGQGIALNLGVSLTNFGMPLTIYVPKKKIGVTLNPMDAFHQKRITPSGIFEISSEIDHQYAIVPKRLVQSLLKNKDKITGVELGLDPNGNVDEIQAEIVAVLGDKYAVKNRYQQNDLFYKTQKTEKLMAFLIITFILIIAIFNVVGSLTMLMVEKENDVAVLLSMGTDTSLVKKIFTYNGLLIALVGTVSGMILGLLLVGLQQYVGLIELGSGTEFLLVSFPVELRLGDFILVFFTVMFIGFLATKYAMLRFQKKIESSSTVSMLNNFR